MKVDFKSRKLKSSIIKITEKAKNNFSLYRDYTVYGVTRDEGISITGNVTSEDLSEYIVVGENTFAFNPYRVNIGSIGFSGKQFNGLVSPAYVVFKTKKDLLPEFLFYYLKSDIGIKLINWYGNRGGVRNALRFDDLGEIDMPDLDVEQQQQALIKLDTAKRSLNVLYKELEQQQTYLQQLHQSILQEAVQGKLTKQNPSDEPATQLLERIKAEKLKLIKEGKLKKEKELPPITKDEIPFELPNGWVWCRLKELGLITGGGTPSTSNAAYWNGNIPWITPKDMKADFLSDAEDKVTIKGLNNSSAKLIPPNSILIVGRSGILKRVLPVCINTVECVVNQDLKVIVPCVKQMARYIQLMLQGHEEFILKNLVKYGMTVHSLMYQEFEMQLFPLPPLVEQQRIVTKVQQLQQQLSQLEQQVQQSQTQAQQLLQAGLKEAFSNKAKVYEQNELLTMAAEPEPSITKLSTKAIPVGKKGFAKQVLGGKIVSLFKEDKNFTHIKFQKLQYLAEHIIEEDLLWNYYRQSAGPYDNKFMHSVAIKLTQNKWFEERNYKFYPLQKVSEIEKHYQNYFSSHYEKLNNLFLLLKNASEKFCEAIATIYAVWNNHIIQKQFFDKEKIKKDFFEWSKRKDNVFSKNEFEKAVEWMQKHAIIPTGFGRLIKEKK